MNSLLCVSPFPSLGFEFSSYRILFSLWAATDQSHLLGKNPFLLKGLGLGHRQQSPLFHTWSSTQEPLSGQTSSLQRKGSLQKQGRMQRFASPSVDSTMHGIKSRVEMTLKSSSCHFSCPESQPELTSSRTSSQFFECGILLSPITFDVITPASSSS